MPHDHDHRHSHAAPGHDFPFAVGVVLNLAFVAVEVFYGLAANSLALLSDAAHNLSDVFGLLIAWSAVHLGRSLPTKRRTYGLRRSSILAALTNAIFLLIVVGGIVWEAIGRFSLPEPVQSHTVIWVAAAGIAINSISALLFVSGRKKDLNINGAFLHMAGDAAISLGVVLAGLAIFPTGLGRLDPAPNILFCGVHFLGPRGLLRGRLVPGSAARSAGAAPPPG